MCDPVASLSRVGMGVAALLRKSAMKMGGWEMSGTGRMVEEKPSYEYTAVLISPWVLKPSRYFPKSQTLAKKMYLRIVNALLYDPFEVVYHHSPFKTVYSC